MGLWPIVNAMNKIIFGFVGEIASGKGTAVKYIEDKYSAKSYKFSTILRDILSRLDIDKTRENLQDISTLIREKFGQDILAKIIAKDVSKDSGQVVVVDGIRLKDDIEYLRKLKNFNLVHVYASPEIRYQRLIRREENVDENKISYEEFLKSQENECEIQLKEVSEQADIKIDNSGTQEELIEKIESYIQEKLQELNQETKQEFKIK